MKSRDVVGLNLKLLGTSTEELYCIDCLADLCGCTVEDLREKIEEFKNEGCTLFS